MKATGIFVSTLLIIDAFLGGYAVGFNSPGRAILVIDPTLPPVVQESKAPDPKKAATPLPKRNLLKQRKLIQKRNILQTSLT